MCFLAASQEHSNTVHIVYSTKEHGQLEFGSSHWYSKLCGFQIRNGLFCSRHFWSSILPSSRWLQHGYWREWGAYHRKRLLQDSYEDLDYQLWVHIVSWGISCQGWDFGMSLVQGKNAEGDYHSKVGGVQLGRRFSGIWQGQI